MIGEVAVPAEINKPVACCTIRATNFFQWSCQFPW